MDARLNAHALLKARFPHYEFKHLRTWANGDTFWCSWHKDQSAEEDAKLPYQENAKLYQLTVTLQGTVISERSVRSVQPVAPEEPPVSEAQRQTCDKKIAYEDRETAARAGLKMADLFGQQQYPYECPVTGRNHS
jgi:hypothetical protein